MSCFRSGVCVSVCVVDVCRWRVSCAQQAGVRPWVVAESQSDGALSLFRPLCSDSTEQLPGWTRCYGSRHREVSEQNGRPRGMLGTGVMEYPSFYVRVLVLRCSTTALRTGWRLSGEIRAGRPQISICVIRHLAKTAGWAPAGQLRYHSLFPPFPCPKMWHWPQKVL